MLLLEMINVKKQQGSKKILIKTATELSAAMKSRVSNSGCCVQAGGGVKMKVIIIYTNFDVRHSIYC